MKKKIVAVALSAVLVTGCASIISKSEYGVAINSNPDRASFVVLNRSGQKIHSGVTPSTVTLKSSAGYFRGETYTVELTKKGFSPKSYTLTSSVDGWYLGNILFGGLLGILIIDPATGAMYSLPDRVDISLDENISSLSSQTLTIATIGSLTEEQRGQLVKL
ncbi:MAG: hypothetical protein HFP77_01075 [Methylococcales symbiont of Iophon sp. n. MRB-2018]|nr:MAG: hypothetical protein HFP77_01075 [Methylococcales symbiont of Iophon sp. n. MRB-2018]KAF3979434.1 MAG: hypothetical protein HFP76_06990 [Methylococcales symbiont of Iophon sp. n. MRB-2018]